jgi:hypothetical protein
MCDAFGKNNRRLETNADGALGLNERGDIGQ